MNSPGNFFMRLSPYQHQAIIDASARCFGEGAQVWLFGSRADDDKRGGDIDLFVRLPQTHKHAATELFKLKIQFLGYLEKALGECKIDVVISSPDTGRPIEQIAQSTGVRLSDSAEILRLREVLATCRQHVQALNDALQDMSSLSLTPSALDRLNKAERRLLDQFAYRYLRLQDDMDARLMPAILASLAEPVATMPAIDRYNRLEQLRSCW